MKCFLKPILISAAVLVISQAAQALPKTVVWIPSTDMIGAGKVELGFESVAQKHPFAEENEQYAYSQLGVSNRFEIGVDMYDVNDDKDIYFNAKYLVTKETEKLPAIAIGSAYIVEGDDPEYYVVGSKTYDKVRLTYGADGCEHSIWGLAGVELTLSPKFTFAADYTSGCGGYSNVGLRYKPTKDLSMQLYYSYNNSKELRADANYVGFLTTYDFSFRK
jgi:hypothetical protein